MKKTEQKEPSRFTWYILSENRFFLMGVAAIFIMIYHSTTCLHYSTNTVLYIVDQLNIGVEMFLFLSGMSNYFSFENKKVKFANYYIKRTISVYLIYLMIALPMTVYGTFFAMKEGFADFILNWTGIGFLTGKMDYPHPGKHPGWYVILIMILYAVYPLIYKCLKFLQKKKLDAVATFAFVFLWIFLMRLFMIKHGNIFGRYEIALTRIPVFILGCWAGGLVYEKKPFDFVSFIWIFCGFMAFPLFYQFIGKWSRYNKTFSSVSLTLIIAMLCYVVKKHGVIYKFISYCGKMSLELYLTHNMMKTFLFKKGEINVWIYLLIIAASFALSIVISQMRRYIISKYDESVKKKIELKSAQE